MERARNDRQWHGRLCLLLAALACGCQTVRTPEEDIANRELPRELTKVSMPEYVVEPPDLLVVEVLEALPGRPISGERLVRPDGKISLGFYGEVYVAGLTLKEVKEKVIIHLRHYISDEYLGLVQIEYDENGNPDEVRKVAPADSNTVFVDVSAYNSKYYYIEGDVNAPGRLPIVGNDTVLDALEFAGGLAPTAAPRNIRLVRPAPPGACCPQILPVNYAAILYEGDPTTNYQLMPGDRLIVYRDPIVRTTLALERLAAPFQTVLNSMLTYSFTKRYLNGSFGFGANTSSSTTTTTPRRFPVPGSGGAQ